MTSYLGDVRVISISIQTSKLILPDMSEERENGYVIVFK